MKWIVALVNQTFKKVTSFGFNLDRAQHLTWFTDTHIILCKDSEVDLISLCKAGHNVAGLGGVNSTNM